MKQSSRGMNLQAKQRSTHRFNVWARSKNGRRVHHKCGNCGTTWISITDRGPTPRCPQCFPTTTLSPNEPT